MLLCEYLHFCHLVESQLCLGAMCNVCCVNKQQVQKQARLEVWSFCQVIATNDPSVNLKLLEQKTITWRTSVYSQNHQQRKIAKVESVGWICGMNPLAGCVRWIRCWLNRIRGAGQTEQFPALSESSSFSLIREPQARYYMANVETLNRNVKITQTFKNKHAIATIETR